MSKTMVQAMSNETNANKGVVSKGSMRIRMPKQLIAAKPATWASNMHPAFELMCLVSCEASFLSHGNFFTPAK